MRSEGLTRRLLIGGIVAALVVAADLLTKWWAASTFRADPLEVIPGLLTFTFAENPGAAFSLFQDTGPLLAVAAIMAVLVIAGLLREPRPILEVVGLGMIAGGAVGNLVDRVARGNGLLDGQVIDWMRFPNFPLFNVADSAITVGVALLLISAWRERHQPQGSQ